MIEFPPDEPGAIGDLVQRYLDRPMDLADASLVWLAGHTGIADVLTLDQGDFQTGSHAVKRHPVLRVKATSTFTNSRSDEFVIRLFDC